MQTHCPNAPRVLVTLALIALPFSLQATPQGLAIEVRNGPWERFRTAVAAPVSPAQASHLAGMRLVETDTNGDLTSSVPFAVDTSCTPPVVTWIAPGIAAGGEVRRYAFVPKGTAPEPPSRTSDLTVTETDSHITISNSFFEVRHPRKGHGGFPDQLRYRLSGHLEDKITFKDRIYSRETRKQLVGELDHDATARLLFSSPFRVVLETSFRYAGGSAPGTPHAIYRWTYSPFSPVVDVSAVFEQDDEQTWDELHFLHPSRKDYHYTTFVVGEPPTEHAMAAPGSKSKSYGGRHWGVMTTDADAIGVGFGGVVCWDAASEFVYYVSSHRPKWTGKRKELEGGLYIGPAVSDLTWYSKWLGPDRSPEVTVTTVDTGLLSNTADSEQTTPTGDYELTNDALRIVFSGKDGGLDCLAIENRLSGNTRFVNPRSEAPGLWQLELRRPYTPPAEGEKDAAEDKLLLDNHVDAVRSAELATDGNDHVLTLRWNGVDLPGEPDVLDVTATVRLRPGNGSSDWRITVDNRSTAWGLWDVQYLYLPTVCRKGTGDVLLPTGNWGGTLKRSNRGAFKGDYPSARVPVQFLAFNRGRAGLYIGAHDAAARAKHLLVTSDQDATWGTYAEDMGVPGSDVENTFPVVIAAYEGDWWEAARIYRTWATQQMWTSKGWIVDRSDIPQSFKELGLWMLGGGKPEGVREWMLETEEFFSPLPVGLHWYNWHQIPFDNSYPEYFPTKEGFADVVRELTGRGQIMMPYINGRLWDSEIPSFGTARTAATKKRDGEPYIEIYASKRKLCAMCPTTKLWQDKVNEIGHRLIHECGVNAIYLDQIGAAKPRLCFDPSHGHPLGGGRHWVDSYRVMLSRLKADAVANGTALTTENTAEPYMDNIDGYLTWVQRNDDDVPLLPAVYSGYTVYFSSPQSASDDLDAFVQAQSRDFLWGCQLGWNGTWIIRPEHRAKGTFFKRLCQYRLAAKDYLVYGRLLDEIRPLNAISSLTTTWNRRKPHPATLPAVMGTAWRNRDASSLAIFLVNTDSQPQRVDYALDLNRWLPGVEADTWLVSRLAPEGSTPAAIQSSDKPIACSEHLAGHEIRALVVTPAPKRTRTNIKQAEKIAAAPPSPELGNAARTFLATQALEEHGLTIVPTETFLTVARGEPAQVTLRIENRERQARELSLRWPDDLSETLPVPGKKSTEHKHIFWPPAEQDGRAAATVTVGLPGAPRTETLQIPLQLRFVNPVTVTLGAVPRVRGGESFLLPVEVRNNSRSVRRGKAELRTPQGWKVEPAARFDLGELAPGQRRDMLLKCRIPACVQTVTTSLAVCFVEEAVEKTVTILRSRLEVRCPRLKAKPEIDGKLDEWPAPPVITLGAPHSETVKITKDYKGADDCSATIRVGWDNSFLYLAAEVTDNAQHQDNSDANLWSGDCIQLAFRTGSPRRTPGWDGSETEIGLTRGPNGPIVFRWNPSEGRLPDAKLAVVREEAITRYEAAIPWKDIGLEQPTESTRMTWSLTVNDNDGSGFHGWLQWTPGICGGKDSSEFGWLQLSPSGD